MRALAITLCLLATPALADLAGTCYATGDRKWSSGESRYNTTESMK